jgi:hypothetical protein
MGDGYLLDQDNYIASGYFADPVTSTFALGAVIIAFRHAFQRPSRSLGFTQPTEASTGGARYGYSLYVKNDLIDLPLRMTSSERTALLAFFRDTARGMVAPFTVTDQSGNTFTARFAASQLPAIQERAYNMHVATVRLRVA